MACSGMISIRVAVLETAEFYNLGLGNCNLGLEGSVSAVFETD